MIRLIQRSYNTLRSSLLLLLSWLVICSLFPVLAAQAEGAKRIDCDYTFSSDTIFGKFQAILSEVQDTKPALQPDGIVKLCVGSGTVISNTLANPVDAIVINRDNVHIEGLGPVLPTFKNLVPYVDGQPFKRVFQISGAAGVSIRNLKIENLSDFSQSIIVNEGGSVDLIENVEFIEGTASRNALQAIVAFGGGAVPGGNISLVRNVRIAAYGVNLIGISATFGGNIESINSATVYLRGSAVTGIRTQAGATIGQIADSTVLMEQSGFLSGPGNSLRVASALLGTVSNSKFYTKYDNLALNSTSSAIRVTATGETPAQIGKISKTIAASSTTSALSLLGDASVGSISKDTVLESFWSGEF